VLKRVIHHAGFGFAFVLFEVALKLLPSLGGILQVFLTSSESKPAHITVGHAGCAADKANDSHVPLCHRN
jgi:hypothetical protein